MHGSRLMRRSKFISPLISRRTESQVPAVTFWVGKSFQLSFGGSITCFLALTYQLNASKTIVRLVECGEGVAKAECF